MKTTTVPAQVTTVEDKVAGSLSMSQLLLLATPIFISGVIYVIVPVNMKFTIPKMILCGICFLIFSSLSVRVKGTIMLNWLIVKLRYNLRPRYYLFNKNDAYLREETVTKKAKTETKAEVAETEEPKRTKEINLTKRVKLEQALLTPAAKVHFLTNKKGGLNVHITEVKQEG